MNYLSSKTSVLKLNILGAIAATSILSVQADELSSTSSVGQMAQNAPQNSNDEYSNINGQLVPVGEKNRYSYRYNKINIWTNPFGYFYGSFGIGASYAVNSNIKLNFAPNFIYFFNSTPKVIGGGATLSASIFFRKVYDGFYLEPGGTFLYLSQEHTFDDAHYTGIVGGPQLIAGWGWIWDAGFTTNIGFGLGYYWGTVGHDITDTSTYRGVFPAGNLQFGYSF